MSIRKAQPGEEAGEFRGGDPEDLQQKREEKRAEQIDSGVVEDEEEEEVDEDELAEQVELEAEKEAVKSYNPINSGSAEVSPVNTWEDYRPTNINGDPLEEMKPIKPIALTVEPRPGKNQHRPWSDVTGHKVPLQGEKWVHLRQFTIRGDEEGAMREQAKFFRALNHGLTFDPDFYIAKAKKGEIKPGHKYVYRWMDESGVWQYDYSGGTHVNHGPGHYGNMQGHSLEVPEGHIDAHDPQKTDPKGAFHAAKDHVMHHGGTFSSSIGGRPMIMRIHGHKGAEPKQKPIELIDPEHVRKDQKVPEGTPLDFEKHKIKGKFADKKFGGSKFRDLKTVEGTIRRGETHTEVDAEDKPFLQWRFAGEAQTTGKGRKKRAGEGRNISFRYIDPDHPVAEDPAEGASKEGWDHSSAKDIDALRKLVAKKKREHGELLGHVKLDTPHKEVKGKPTINWIHQGGIKRKPTKRAYNTSGMFDPDYYGNGYGRWVSAEDAPEPPAGSRYKKRRSFKKERTVLTADITPEERVDLLSDLTRAPTDDDPKGGELYKLIQYAAARVVNRINNRRAWHGRTPISYEAFSGFRDELIGPGREGVSEALDMYDLSHPSKASFITFAFNRIMKAQSARARTIAADFGETAVLASGGGHPGKRPPGTSGVEAAEEQQAKQYSGDSEQAELDKLAEYEDPNRWFEKAENHLAAAVEHISPDEFEHKYAQITQAEENLEQLKKSFRDHQDPDVIVAFTQSWNDPGRGGPGFFPEFKLKDSQRLMDKLDLLGRGGKSSEETLHHDFGKERLDESLDELHSMMEGADSVGQPGYEETEHAQVGITDPDIQRYVKENKLKTVRDLINHINKTPITGSRGVPSRRASNNLSRFTNWLRNDPNLDLDYGVPPFRGEKPAGGQRAIPTSEKAPTVDISGGVKKRSKAEKAIQILQKAPTPEKPIQEPTGQSQEPSPESHPQMFNTQGQKLFQPVPEGVQVEENPEYDPDPTGGKNWSGKYQDSETGATRYSYLHADRSSNPKLHHNNSMRYLDAQLPKIRQWYKEKLGSGQPMERAIGLFLMLMDQAKIRHHDEAEGGLATLTVGQIRPGNGDVITFQFSDNYIVDVTLDQQAKMVLQELMEGKEPEVRLFQIEGQFLDPGTVEEFLQGTFGVDAGSFRTLHSTKQYSKEFQKLADDGVEDIEQTKEQALSNTATSMGHQDGANAVRNHVDPVAQEALHMMAKKSLLTNPETGESMTAKGWAKRYAQAIRKAAYKLQDRIEFQGFKISVENKKGSIRKWHDPHGKENGETKMHFTYGYIRGTKGTDGDHVDVYIGDNEDADTVYVVHQMKKPDFKKYDEDKVMMGFGTAKEAKAAYVKQYDDPKFFGSMTPMSIEEFRTKVMDKDNHGKVIKSHVWQVSVEHPDRTDEEELFSQWLHDYPIHEHETRWAKQKELDKKREGEIKPISGHPGTGVEVKTHDFPVDEEESTNETQLSV
jgi:hypothetical protein